MTLARVALQLIQEQDPDWYAWMRTWVPQPKPGVLVDTVVVDDALQCHWLDDATPVEVIWKERELLEALKTKTEPSLAAALLWRLARVVSDPDELDSLIRQVVVKETGLTPEPVPFVRKGLLITSRMDAAVAEKAKPSQLVNVTVDQHGTLIKLMLTDSRIRALLDRFLRRHLWTV